MGEHREAQIWSAIHGDNHPHLEGDERTIESYMPLITELFPGINYYSMAGFSQVMKDRVQPALTKLFPDIANKVAHQVDSDRNVGVGAFLPSEGYEHQNDPAWSDKFEELLVA